MVSPGSVAGRPPLLPWSLTTTVTRKVPFQSARVAAPAASGKVTWMLSMRLLICASVPTRVTVVLLTPATVPPVPPTPEIRKPAGTLTVTRRLPVSASASVMSMPVSTTVAPPSATVCGVTSTRAGSFSEDRNTWREFWATFAVSPAGTAA